jgi:hypothetical protein
MANDQGLNFADLYHSKSEPELQALASDWYSLTTEARTALSAEFTRRKLDFVEPPQIEEEDLPEFRDLITLRRFRDLSEAIVARGALESAGIFCFLKDENTVRLDWQISNMIGGIRLQVYSADVEAAEEVLNQPIPDTIHFADEPSFEQPRCPQCDSTDITYEGTNRSAALASLYLFSVPLPLGSPSWTCNHCGARWQDTEDAERHDDRPNPPA